MDMAVESRAKPRRVEVYAQGPVAPRRAAIYARISDDAEGRAAGVTRQVEDTTALLERLGWEQGPWAPFIDNDIGASTKTRKRRPQYDALLELVQRGECDGVVFYSNSRLTRRPREFEDWIELVDRTGVQLASCVSGNADLSTADGRMIARILAAQDAAEAERIGERVVRANVQRRQAGRPEPSSRAFGFEKGGEEINEAEAALIRQAVDRVVNEGWSLGMVVKDWNKRGVPTVRNGKGWSRIQVSRALTSPRTAGLLSLKGEIIGEGKFGQIITPEQREQVLERVQANRKNQCSYSQRKNLLAGFMVCGRCDKPVKVNMLYEADGVTPRKDAFVHCSRSQFGCGNLKRNLAMVMGYIDGVIRNRIELFEPLGEAEETGEADDQVRELEARLAEVQDDISELKAAFAQRQIRFKDYNEALAQLRTQEEMTERAIGEAAKFTDTLPDIDLLAAWEDGDIEEKRVVLSHFIDHIRLHPVGRIGPKRVLESMPISTEIVFREL